MEELHLSKQRKVTINIVIGHVDIVQMVIEHGKDQIHLMVPHIINGQNLEKRGPKF